MFYRYLAKQISDSYDKSFAYPWKDGTSIVGTTGSELLTGSGKGVSIFGGAGNDTITAYGLNMKVLGEDGNDYILVSSLASSAEIDGGAGNDSIKNTARNVSIDAGSGDNYILNQYGFGYLSATQEYDSILPDNATISTGAGNDTIYNYGSKVSIDSGAGNDYIYTNGNAVTICAGGGNDTILGFDETSTLQIMVGSYSSTKSGSDIVVTFGTGKITLVGAGSLEKLNIAGSEKVTTPSTLLTVTNSTTSPLTIDAAVKNVNASKRTTAIKITGNALANSIVGGSKNDSIYGNAGKLASSC